MYLWRQVANLVQKQRAAVRLLHAARLVRHGSRKRAFPVSEQFRGGKLSCQHTAVHGYERSIRTPAPFVYLLRYVILARTVLTQYQHTHVCRSYQRDTSAYFLKGRTSALEYGDGASDF